MDPRSTLCNWLLNRQFENKNSQSLKRPDKCVQSETVVPLSPQNENKVKSNVSPWLETVTTITANGGIITSSGSSLHRGTQQEYSSKPLQLNIALLNVFLISVYMVDIGICLSPKIFHLFGIRSWRSSDPKIIGIKTYLYENFSEKKKSSRKF